LNDTEKRRKYDSTLEFDDSIPDKFDPETEDFYAEFGRIFRKNARWSKKNPVPDLGDSKTSLKKVFKFYEFWEKFDSWRDFTHEEEYDLNEAENR
jgi:DnaJ family protein C protein 2